jgi:hypothetical protein
MHVNRKTRKIKDLRQAICRGTVRCAKEIPAQSLKPYLGAKILRVGLFVLNGTDNKGEVERQFPLCSIMLQIKLRKKPRKDPSSDDACKPAKL